MQPSSEGGYSEGKGSAGGRIFSSGRADTGNL